MKKYYVTMEKEQHGVIDGVYLLKTDDEDEAIKEARYFSSRTSDKSAKVEIRMYKEDIEDESCDCFDYDTLDLLALNYYGRPDFYWIIADFNGIKDPFIDLPKKFKTIRIPTLTQIYYGS